MAISLTELVGTDVRAAVHGIHATEVRTVEFATDAGAPLLPVGEPVAFDDTALKWKDWTHNGGNATGSIRAFVFPFDVQLSATTETLGVVMTKGEINYADIKLPAGESEANLKAALRAGQEHDAVGAGDPIKDQPSLSELGITVRGLSQIR